MASQPSLLPILPRRLPWGGSVLLSLWLVLVLWGQAGPARRAGNYTMVVCQVPVDTQRLRAPATVAGALMPDYGPGTRLVLAHPDGTATNLTQDFDSACDPDIAFDGRRLLFAAKRKAADAWAIFEMNLDDRTVKQITRDLGDCRQPGYQATFYTIVSSEPWYQLTFVRIDGDTVNEWGGEPSTHLYACKLDGTAPRRLTHNLSMDVDPFIKADGRLVYAAWQRSRLNHGPAGRVSLFDINTDGADAMALCADQGKRIKHMPCVTSEGLVVFVESEDPMEDGSGSLGSVQLRRPLHSYRALTAAGDGLFHGPSPLSDGNILVSHRPAGNNATHAVYVMNPKTGRRLKLFDDPQYHDVQAQVVQPRPEPDGRSSVVTEEDPFGKLYCLNAYLNDMPRMDWLGPDSVKRVRVLEGIPIRPGQGANTGTGPLAQRRILGETEVASDGSFNVEIPGATPIELQLLDQDGLALRTCSWIWAQNHEPRGCIGCHEDPELTPENLLVEAVTRPAVQLTLPPERRRTIDFCADVAPILERNCVKCHAQRQPFMRLATKQGDVHTHETAYPTYESLLARDASGRYTYAHPGQARTSLLIWRIMGRNTARPWDKGVAKTDNQISRMPPAGSEALAAREKQILIEWIDLGAAWDGIPAAEPGK